MTTLSQTWGYTCRVCDFVTSAIGGFFVSLHRAMMVSRQIETNMKLSKMLKHDYPGLTEDEILNELNYKTIQRSYNDR